MKVNVKTFEAQAALLEEKPSMWVTALKLNWEQGVRTAFITYYKQLHDGESPTEEQVKAFFKKVPSP